MQPTETLEAINRVTATETKLFPEQALVKRWLRSGFAPLEVWQWLAGRAPHTKLVNWSPAPAVRRMLTSLGQPLASQSNQHERTALDRNLSLTASLLAFVYGRTPDSMRLCHNQMMAACLLPLYRGLASGSVAEVTAVMRRQLADALTLTALAQEFPDELPNLLRESLDYDQPPYEVIQNSLGVGLERLAQLMLTVSHGWTGADCEQLHTLVGLDVQVDQRPAWGTPAILWRLAGELIADRSEFVVPRDWVQVPVPWNEAGEHCRELAHLLASPAQPDYPANVQHAKADASVQSKNRTPNVDDLSGTLPSSAAKTSEASDVSTSTDSAKASDASKCSDRLVLGPTAPGVIQAAGLTGSDSTVDVSQRAGALAPDVEQEIAETVEALMQTSRDIVRSFEAQVARPLERSKPTEFVVPKMIIAEIRSHNDPAFVAVVRRQLAICRSDDRCMSLIAADVRPDGDAEGNEVADTPLPRSPHGLASWQHRLVNWLSVHPEVSDPHAFVSSQGEIILCLMDIERNAATVLLRQGLVHALTGRAIDGETSTALSRVAIPARFHSGIASVSTPTAGFESEQLIEATYRCLAAAQRHGKASIKSIEVF